jgi:beta-phosphoglucomutase
MTKAQPVAILFDMDGVIVDNHKYHMKAWEVFSRRYDIKTEADKLTEMFGGTNEEILPEMFGRKLGKQELDRLADEKEALYRQLYAEHMVETPGLSSFLQRMHHAGIPMAVATSAPPANADFVLDTLGIRHFFQYVTTASDITHGKPHPEIYLLTASRLGIAPENCIVIEDSTRGIQSGLAAGMRVIAITTTHKAEMLGDAHRVVEGFEGLIINY